MRLTSSKTSRFVANSRGACAAVRCIRTQAQRATHLTSPGLSQALPLWREHPPRVILTQSSGGDAQAPQSGQVTSALMNSMSMKIQEALEAKRVEVRDVYGDGRHVSIEVVSDQFEGQSAMKRQRLVYKAIWLELQEAVHAVDSMSTLTSSEAKL
ncbi:hypothetical protein CEUSTIGMA_g8256.t1 [Chlamydomonas eustigma]|uniref:BolA protein n=1 Tax=Chlamydomonas eustigma TaxID=1157962 RepID=A0A250XCL6_9CHLO|nr:hypothetical protein CEUSTIGMA_g8256.t1 [Chlamydomonas eustigma]|eukprot:GAX80821.1 hypothetical protein CEUSTIGMA_g8256.t1 [Chlamydomonas eustigma]